MKGDTAMYYYKKITAPIFKELHLVATEKGISHVFLTENEFEQFQANASIQRDDVGYTEEAVQQIEEYFAGSRKAFNLSIDLQKGTAFQREVWRALSEIPFGVTKSYQDVATLIGRPKAVRALGQANRNNPLPIVVPCHRVIGKDRRLTGYAGDKLAEKEQLLALEGILVVEGMIKEGQ